MFGMRMSDSITCGVRRLAIERLGAAGGLQHPGSRAA